MLRTVFMIGLFAVLGLFVLKLVFGILGGLFVLFLGLLKLAIWITVVGVVLYLILRVLSPRTAERLRERFSGNAI